jgi:hypothetical protein
MKKPHEQEWRTNNTDSRWVETTDGLAVAEAYPAANHGGHGERVEIARFIASAPDMARALLELADTQVAKDGLPCWCWEGEHVESTVRSCHRVRAALRKAGVL